MDDEVCKVSATIIDQHLACENGGDYQLLILLLLIQVKKNEFLSKTLVQKWRIGPNSGHILAIKLTQFGDSSMLWSLRVGARVWDDWDFNLSKSKASGAIHQESYRRGAFAEKDDELNFRQTELEAFQGQPRTSQVAQWQRIHLPKQIRDYQAGLHLFYTSFLVVVFFACVVLSRSVMSDSL